MPIKQETLLKLTGMPVELPEPQWIAPQKTCAMWSRRLALPLPNDNTTLLRMNSQHGLTIATSTHCQQTEMDSTPTSWWRILAKSVNFCHYAFCPIQRRLSTSGICFWNIQVLAVPSHSTNAGVNKLTNYRYRTSFELQSAPPSSGALLTISNFGQHSLIKTH